MYLLCIWEAVFEASHCSWSWRSKLLGGVEGCDSTLWGKTGQSVGVRRLTVHYCQVTRQMFIIDHCISGDGVEDNVRDMIRNEVCANGNLVLCDRCTPTSLQRSQIW